MGRKNDGIIPNAFKYNQYIRNLTLVLLKYIYFFLFYLLRNTAPFFMFIVFKNFVHSEHPIALAAATTDGYSFWFLYDVEDIPISDAFLLFDI
jgi:hypothetical protein